MSGRVDGEVQMSLAFQHQSELKLVNKQFSIRPGAFYDCVVPQEVEAMWGPVPVQSLPQGVQDNNCKAVTHK